MDQKLARKLLTQTSLSDLTESLTMTLEGRRGGGGEEGSLSGLSRQFPRTQYSYLFYLQTRLCEPLFDRASFAPYPLFMGYSSSHSSSLCSVGQLLYDNPRNGIAPTVLFDINPPSFINA